MKRTKLANRILPSYSIGEERMNMITHICGGGLSIIASSCCLGKAITSGLPSYIIATAIYSLSLMVVYSMSSIYHGLHCCTGKKVLQILDHCAIYLLIAGTYTPILLCAVAPVYPLIGWGLLGVQWILASLAISLTAIDLKNYRVFSMCCYIGMGWSILLFLPQTISVITPAGFVPLLAGGIAYTLGAAFFGMGTHIKWLHSVFHIFVVIGSMLHCITILFYVL